MEHRIGQRTQRMAKVCTPYRQKVKSGLFSGGRESPDPSDANHHKLNLNAVKRKL